MKFTRDQINKARKEKREPITIVHELYSIEGDLFDLVRRIKSEVKDARYFKEGRWPDGDKFKLDQIELVECEEDQGYYSSESRTIHKAVAVKVIKETDAIVIARLTSNAKIKAKAKTKRKDKKIAQEKRERSLLKTLKEKYKEDA